MALQAGKKAQGGTALKFQAEATANLRKGGVDVTDDSPKYVDRDIKVRLGLLQGGAAEQGMWSRRGGVDHWRLGGVLPCYACEVEPSLTDCKSPCPLSSHKAVCLLMVLPNSCRCFK